MTPRAPLLQLLLERPQVLAEHLLAYADLLGAESIACVARAERRLLLQAFAAGLLAAAVGLAGVALMLWAVLAMLSSGGACTGPVGSAPAILSRDAGGWLLLVPLLPALGAWAAWYAARHDRSGGSFAVLREQLRADLAVLREAGLAMDRP